MEISKTEKRKTIVKINKKIIELTVQKQTETFVVKLFLKRVPRPLKDNIIVSFFLIIHLFIYGCVGSSFLCEGFMAVLGLRFCARAFSSCSKWGSLFITVCGPLTITASLVAEHRLQTRRLSNCGSWT